MSVLAVEVGNTVTTIGVVEGAHVVVLWQITTPCTLTVDEAIMCVRVLLNGVCETDSFEQPTDAILASVVPTLSDAWCSALAQLFGRRPLVVGPGVKTGLKMRYRNPAEVGADRVAHLVGALALYEPPFIVVALEIATTIEVIDREGVFLGGLIGCGLNTGQQALADTAAQLTPIDIQAPRAAIGRSTREALQSGVVLGEVARIDGLVAMVEAEVGPVPCVIATGQHVQVIAQLSNRITHVEESLDLAGLGLIYARNRAV